MGLADFRVIFRRFGRNFRPKNRKRSKHLRQLGRAWTSHGVDCRDDATPSGWSTSDTSFRGSRTSSLRYLRPVRFRPRARIGRNDAVRQLDSNSWRLRGRISGAECRPVSYCKFHWNKNITKKTLYVFKNGPIPASFLYFRLFNIVDSKCSI